MSVCNWKTTLFGNASFFTIMISKLRKLVDFTSNVEPKDAFNEVLFYGADDEDVRKQMGLNNLFCIYYVLVHAKDTIDICVPSLMSDTITNCLVKIRHVSNIRIKLAVHSNENQDINELADHGIEVKFIKSKIRLEHEFILIDAYNLRRDSLAIIGSLDYEVNHVNCNRDTTLLTSETAVILALKREFERVWNGVDE